MSLGGLIRLLALMAKNPTTMSPGTVVVIDGAVGNLVLGHECAAVRVDWSRPVDVLEVEDSPGGGGRRGQRPVVACRLRCSCDAVVERLRQRAVPGGAAVLPDQAPPGRRRDRGATREPRVHRCDQHVASRRGRRALDREPGPPGRGRRNGTLRTVGRSRPGLTRRSSLRGRAQVRATGCTDEYAGPRAA